jgi:hypothetical protein
MGTSSPMPAPPSGRRPWLTAARLGVAAVATIAVGFGAFTAVRALTSPEEPWLVPMAEPVLSTELDPDLALGAALADLQDRAILADDTTGPEDLDGDRVDDAPMDGDEGDDHAPLELSISGPLPPGIAPAQREVDVTAIGHAPLSDAEVAAIPDRAGPDGSVPVAAPTRPAPHPIPGSAGPADEPLPERPPAVVDLAPEEPEDHLDEPPTPDDLRDEETRFLFGLDLGVGFWDIPPHLLRPPSEPDFLDVCAADFGDEDITCGDGTGATVLPLELRRNWVTAFGYDDGPRCTDHLDVDLSAGFPVRATFRSSPSSVRVVTRGVTDPRQRAQQTIVVDDARREAARGAGSFDQCFLLPYLEGEDRVQVVLTFGSTSLDRYETVIPIPSTALRGERPPTRIDTVGDRTVRIHVPNRDGLAVAATVVTRDPGQPALTSQCGRIESGDLALEEGRIVELRPAGSVAVRPPDGADRRFDHHQRFTTQLLGGPDDRFELCLRWEERRGSATEVVHREAHYLDPPRRQTVEVVLTEGTFVDPASSEDTRPISMTIHFQPDGGGEPCQLFRRTAELTDVLPYRICAFETIDGIRGGRLELITYPPHSTGAAAETRAFRVILPTDPRHPRSGDRCHRCVDLYDFTLLGFDPDRARDGQVRIAVVTSGIDEDRGWVTFPLIADDPERDDRPVLDVDRTRVEASYSEVNYAEAHRGNPTGSRIQVTAVADRPVQARLIARPQRLYETGEHVVLPCGPTRFPHVSQATTTVFDSQVTVEVDQVCPALRYRLALELVDEDGNRAVYGDLWTAMMLDRNREPSDEQNLDAAYVPGYWPGVATVPGRPLRLSYEVEISLVHPDNTYLPGVYAREPQYAAGVTRVQPPGFPFEAERTRIDLAEARVGPIGMSTGTHSGDDPCVDGGRTIHSGIEEAEVGHLLPVEARVRLHTLNAPTMAFNHCQGDVLATRLMEHSSYTTNGRFAGRELLITYELVRNGGATVVLVSEPNDDDDRRDLRFQAIFRIQVHP